MNPSYFVVIYFKEDCKKNSRGGGLSFASLFFSINILLRAFFLWFINYTDVFYHYLFIEIINISPAIYLVIHSPSFPSGYKHVISSILKKKKNQTLSLFCYLLSLIPPAPSPYHRTSQLWHLDILDLISSFNLLNASDRTTIKKQVRSHYFSAQDSRHPWACFQLLSHLSQLQPTYLLTLLTC